MEKTKRKILFGTDYDGTYCMGARPAESDIAAAAGLRRRGHLFGIVTGRDLYEAMAIEELFEGEYDFILCSSGAVCALPERRILWREYCRGELILPLYELCISLGAIHIHSDITGVRGGFSAIREAKAVEGKTRCNLLYWDGEFHSAMVYEDMLGLVEGFTQFTVYFPSEEIATKALPVICGAFKGEVECHSLGTGFDINRSGIGKAWGVGQLARRLGVDAADVWVAGDSYNDIDMLSEFNGIAMTHGAPEARAAAEFTAPSVKDAVSLAMD